MAVDIVEDTAVAGAMGYGTELAYNLGENAVGIAGSFGGGALTEAYETAVEVGSECVEYLADKAQNLADNVIECVKDNVPDVLDDVKSAFVDFSSKVKLPFSF